MYFLCFQLKFLWDIVFFGIVKLSTIPNENDLMNYIRRIHYFAMYGRHLIKNQHMFLQQKNKLTKIKSSYKFRSLLRVGWGMHKICLTYNERTNLSSYMLRHEYLWDNMKTRYNLCLTTFLLTPWMEGKKLQWIWLEILIAGFFRSAYWNYHIFSHVIMTAL